jgi:hypothetical protein
VDVEDNLHKEGAVDDESTLDDNSNIVGNADDNN